MAINHGGGNMCLVCRGRGERRREWVRGRGRKESGVGGKGEEDEWVRGGSGCIGLE